MLEQLSPITLFINNKNGKLVYHNPPSGTLPFEKDKAQYYTDLNNDGIIDIIQYIEYPADEPQTIEIFYGKNCDNKLSVHVLVSTYQLSFCSPN